ncbi:MAG: hypothetical protein EA353_09640 [Puniceicoccaceae bacterium]|nr:MAG: hypothetical protein EA353_09640 [Puniceicoccaceae bacterium]
MKLFTLLLFFYTLILAVTYSSADEPSILPISKSEAAAIVQAQEMAKEAAKDAREAELKSADITQTLTLKQGEQTIVFNKVRPNSAHTSLESVSETQSKTGKATITSAELLDLIEKQKNVQSITLSGEVHEATGISELWWTDGEQRFRVFTNANFLYLGGISRFEDKAVSYSVFSIITPDYSNREAEKWRPALSDFTEGTLEYLIMEGSGDVEAYYGLEAMLRYYAENEQTLRIAYENNKKLREARRAYLKAHPPKQRDIIMNYSAN